MAVKKLCMLLSIVPLFISMSNSRIVVYRGTYATYKYFIDDQQTAWNPWLQVSVDVSFDLTKWQVFIDADEPQTLDIVQYDGKVTDSKGGNQIQLSIIDQEHKRGKLRLRVEESGLTQMYLDYADITWCWVISPARYCSPASVKTIDTAVPSDDTKIIGA